MSDPTTTFVGRLAPPACHDLAALVRRREHDAHTSLALHSDPAAHVAIVREGLVKARATVRGREVVLDLFGPGDVVGEVASIDHGVRSADLVALTDVAVDRVASPAFSTFLDAHHDACRALLEVEAGRLRAASRRLVEYAALDAVGRVCGRLVELSDRFGVPRGDTVHMGIPLTQSDLAAWAGLSREAVVQALGRLRRRHLVATGPAGIVVLDAPALRDLAATD